MSEVGLLRGRVSAEPWGPRLGGLAQREFSGELAIDHAGKRYAITFARGDIVDAVSPVAADAVVRVALTGRLIAAAHSQAITRAIASTPGRDEVAIVAQIAGLDDDQVRKLRTRLVAQRAARTFALDDGELTTRAVTPRSYGVAVDVAAVIYDGARTNYSEVRLATELRALGARFGIPAATHEYALARFGFDDEVRVLALALRGEGATLAELEARHREVDPRAAAAAVYALVSCGVAVAVAPTAPAVQAAAPASTPSPMTAARAASAAAVLTTTAPSVTPVTAAGADTALRPSPTREHAGAATPIRVPAIIPPRASGSTPANATPIAPAAAIAPPNASEPPRAGTRRGIAGADDVAAIRDRAPPGAPELKSRTWTLPRRDADNAAPSAGDAPKLPPRISTKPISSEPQTPSVGRTSTSARTASKVGVAPPPIPAAAIRNVAPAAAAATPSVARTNTGSRTPDAEPPPTTSAWGADFALELPEPIRPVAAAASVAAAVAAPASVAAAVAAPASVAAAVAAPASAAAPAAAAAAEPEPEPEIEAAPPPRTVTKSSTPAPAPVPRAHRATAAPQFASPEALAEIIESKLSLVAQGADYFAMLGLAADAPADAVRLAATALERELVAEWLIGHELAPAADRLLDHVRVAVAMLSDPSRRSAYLAALQRAGEPQPQSPAPAPAPRTRTGDQRTPAANARQTGLAALQSDQPARAVVELTKAFELEPDNIDTAIHLVWARFCAATSKSSVADETRTALTSGIELAQPGLAHFYLGRMERILGRDRAALAHFQQVVVIDPSNRDALAEVRLLESRLTPRR